MKYAITPMQASEYDEVVAFWRSQDGIGLNESDERGPISRYLQRNAGLSLVVRDSEGAIIATVLCGHDGRRGFLHHMAVAPAWRRQGLGTVLVERCMEQLAAEGIPKCNVFVLTDNADARRFWERMGFKGVVWSQLQRVTRKA